MLGEFTMRVENKAAGYEYQSNFKYPKVEDAVVSAFLHAFRQGLMLFTITILNGNNQEKVSLTVSRAS